jgi:predicted TIM-barrel fold metal-dependent hydrolase
MLRIDADTHVDETEDTWEYMTREEARFKPISIDPGKPIIAGDVRAHRFWLADGRLGTRRWRDDERTGTTAATRSLHDVKARVQHMDERGVDVQVIYPTYMLHGNAARPEVELAMCRSYNRWLADRTAEASGRLRWVVVPPTMSMDATLEELRFGKEHGACGVFKSAIECGGKLVGDPHFYPLYEEAMRLDLPICIHTGIRDFEGTSAAGAEDRIGVRPQIGCFEVLAMRGVPDRFPALRFGVIEAMASWVPHIIADLKAKDVYGGVMKRYAERPFSLKDDFLQANRFFVTCQTSDDVAYLLKFGAENSLMTGTDYAHADQSAVAEALDFIEQLGEDGEIPMEVAVKILGDNPRTFYGL